MKSFLLALGLLTTSMQQNVHAHSSHGVDEDTAIKIVYEAVTQFTAADSEFEVGQLEETWNSISESDVEVVETDGDFYVMRATNSETQASIYFLIGINGKILEVKNTNDF